ncbi:PHO85 cyclin-5 [Rhodotorula kratochvilovae]
MTSLLTPPYSSPETDAPPLSDAAHRLYLARSRSHTSQQRGLPEAKRTRGVSPSQRPPLARSSSTSRRTAAVSSSVHDWVSGGGAALPPTPAQQACPYPDADDAHLAAFTERAAWAAPSAPMLGAHGEHYSTPESSPEGVDELHRAAAGPSRAATLPSLAGRSSFVKRDDLTAKAVARAASLSSVGGLGRRHTDSTLPSVTAPQQHGNDKDRFVSGLVGASVLAIESIWGPSSPPSTTSPAPSSTSGASDSGVLPLQWFVKEVLRRSRTSCSTLQLALYYLHKSRREIRDAVARADASRGEMVRLEQELKAVKARAAPGAFTSSSYPSPPRSPSDELDSAHATHASALASELGSRFSELVEAQNSPVLCGRRMFLAALISASKYLQDRNYSNRAWAKISGLAVGEINKNERAFLQVVQFQLHLRAEDFQRWTERLATLSPSPSPQSSPAPPEPLGAVPSSHSRQGLARAASEYALLSEPSSAQLSAGARAHGPLTAAARTALSRGHSSAAVLGGGARERGFPIAQPMAYRQPAPAAGAGSDSDSSSYSAAAHEPRKVRALPTRRTAAAPSLVPSSWSSGSAASGGVGMEGVVLTGAPRRVDAVKAH